MPEDTKRCVIYTRKSVTEGLEQEFNSLDAQRESGENYIASQRGRGWVCLPNRYDDGGWSGATTKRPALQRLLEDAAQKKFDIVVVYKLDRLSRSIGDSSYLDQYFSNLGVTLVSVTQAIDTSTSAGRMFFNILMSYAQYEREVIAERVKDKMSATRKRGQWTGGRAMLGYNAVNKKLVVNPQEVEIAKRIFTRYTEVQSPKQIALELNRDGLKTKTGKPWNVQQVNYILNSHIYIGEIKYEGQIWLGEHEGIISRELWNRVHEIQKSNCPYDSSKVRYDIVAPLKGILRCGHCDCLMSPTYGIKNHKRYYYYLCVKDKRRTLASCPIQRISSGDIETAVQEQVKKLLASPLIIGRVAEATGFPAADVAGYFTDEFWSHLQPGEANRLYSLFLEKIVIQENNLELEFRTNGLRGLMEGMMYG